VAGLVYDWERLLLLTWHAESGDLPRIALLHRVCSPVLHWFNSINEFLFHEDAVPERCSPATARLRSNWCMVGFCAGCRWRPDLRNSPSAARPWHNRPPQAPHGRLRTWRTGRPKEAHQRGSCKIGFIPRDSNSMGWCKTAFFCTAPGTGKTFLAEATGGDLRSTTVRRSQPVSLKADRHSESNIRDTCWLTHTGRCCFSWTRSSIGTQPKPIGPKR